MQFMVLQICSFKCFQPTQPVVWTWQTDQVFSNIVLIQRKNFNSVTSLCSCFGAKLRVSLSVSFSFPLTPPEEEHRMWDHKYIYVFQNQHGKVARSKTCSDQFPRPQKWQVHRSGVGAHESVVFVLFLTSSFH